MLGMKETFVFILVGQPNMFVLQDQLMSGKIQANVLVIMN